MKQYLDLIDNIITNGVEKESGRANMPNTIGISHGVIKMNLADGFPLLTTKKMYWKGVVHELLWFLRGETNIKYLVDNSVNIWNPDSYRWYLKQCKDNNLEVYFDTIEKFVDFIKNDSLAYYTNLTNREFKVIDGIHDMSLISHIMNLSQFNYIIGDLGKVYGYQWRNQNGVDQVKDVIDGLKANPFSRYHIIDGWNKADFNEMALPPCHLLYQFIVRPITLSERQNILHYSDDYVDIYNDTEESLDTLNVPRFYLDLNMYQRSCDSACGIPFNIASMSLLLMLFAKASNMIAGEATWIGGDTHLYLSHIETAKEQLKREPFKLPELIINKDLYDLDDILNLNIDDFELLNYESHPAIKYELFVGLKKK